MKYGGLLFLVPASRLLSNDSDKFLDGILWVGFAGFLGLLIGAVVCFFGNVGSSTPFKYAGEGAINFSLFFLITGLIVLTVVCQQKE